MSELHDWLNTLSDMMKAEKIVLGDSEDMEGLLDKQKVTVNFFFFGFHSIPSSLITSNTNISRLVNTVQTIENICISVALSESLHFETLSIVILLSRWIFL